MLAQRFKWTPNQIAELTRHQQIEMMQDSSSSPDSPLKFDNVEDYLEWAKELKKVAR